jgi:hypothetical protein
MWYLILVVITYNAASVSSTTTPILLATQKDCGDAMLKIGQDQKGSAPNNQAAWYVIGYCIQQSP